jgi:hypothetical protein
MVNIYNNNLFKSTKIIFLLFFKLLADTMKKQESMKNCHLPPMSVDCSDSVKSKFIFKHVNDTHHECSLLSDNKCSSSLNAFETLEACEKTCHHDNH